MALELDFAVAGQALSRTDGDAVAAGAVGMQAKFTFDSAWDGLGTIIARFAGPTHEHFDATVTAGACTVPWEALAYPMMIVSVAGYTGGLEKVTTQDLVIPVLQSQSSLQVPAPPTPTVYDQLVAQATAAAMDAAQAQSVATAARASATAAQASAATAAAGMASKADLVDGVLATSQLPALAITSFLGVVASESDMLALKGQLGDFCTRSDTIGMYVVTGDDPTKATSWTEISYPPAPVTSVNNQTGSVMLGKADIGLGSVDNTSDVDKPISTAVQAALDAKQDALVNLTQAEYDALTTKDASTVYLVG